jgi:hypothetical protein
MASRHIALLAGISLTVLTGCATNNTSSSVDGRAVSRAAFEAAHANLTACLKEVQARPEFSILHFHNSDISATEMADDHYPSAEYLRKGLAAWDAMAPCRQAFLTAFASSPINRPDAVQIYTAFYNANAAEDVRYSKGHETIGQHAQTLQTLATELRSNLTAADTAFQQRLIQAQQVQQQIDAQRAATALGIWSAMQPQRVQVQMCGTWGCH